MLGLATYLQALASFFAVLSPVQSTYDLRQLKLATVVNLNVDFINIQFIVFVSAKFALLLT